LTEIYIQGPLQTRGNDEEEKEELTAPMESQFKMMEFNDKKIDEESFAYTSDSRVKK